MKRRSIFVTACLVFGLCGLGYSQPLSVEVSERPNPIGGKVLSVQNISRKAIVAIVVTVSGHDRRGKMISLGPRIYDATMDFGPGAKELVPAILPGQVWTVQTPGDPLPGERRLWATRRTAVRAVLFSDGTSEGDALWIQKVLDRRRGALRAARAIWDALSQADRNKTTRTALAEQLRKRQKELLAEVPLYSPVDLPLEELHKTERFAIETVFGLVAYLWYPRFVASVEKEDFPGRLAHDISGARATIGPRHLRRPRPPAHDD